MNYIYRSIWNESLGSWVAVSELDSACGSRSVVSISSGRSSARDSHDDSFRLTTCMSSLAVVAMALLGSNNAFAGQVAVCNGSNSANTMRNNPNGANSVGITALDYCTTTIGAALQEDYNQTIGGSAASLFLPHRQRYKATIHRGAHDDCVTMDLVT